MRQVAVSPRLTNVTFPARQAGAKIYKTQTTEVRNLNYDATMQQTPASITRPNMGSLAYVWIGDKEHVVGTTSEAHHLMNKKGSVTFISRSGQTEHYIIEGKKR